MILGAISNRSASSSSEERDSRMMARQAGRESMNPKSQAGGVSRIKQTVSRKRVRQERAGGVGSLIVVIVIAGESNLSSILPVDRRRGKWHFDDSEGQKTRRVF